MLLADSKTHQESHGETRGAWPETSVPGRKHLRRGVAGREIHRRRHGRNPPRRRVPAGAALRRLDKNLREEIHILEWGGAAAVPDGNRFDQGASLQVQRRHRKIVAATGRLQTFRRPGAADGQRRGVVSPASHCSASFHGR